MVDVAASEADCIVLLSALLLLSCASLDWYLKFSVFLCCFLLDEGSNSNSLVCYKCPIMPGMESIFYISQLLLLAIRAMLVFKSQIYPHFLHPSKPKTIILMIITKSYLVFTMYQTIQSPF